MVWQLARSTNNNNSNSIKTQHTQRYKRNYWNGFFCVYDLKLVPKSKMYTSLWVITIIEDFDSVFFLKIPIYNCDIHRHSEIMYFFVVVCFFFEMTSKAMKNKERNINTYWFLVWEKKTHKQRIRIRIRKRNSKVNSIVIISFSFLFSLSNWPKPNRWTKWICIKTC